MSLPLSLHSNSDISSKKLLNYLDQRIEQHLLCVVEQTELVKLIRHPDTDKHLALSLFQQLMVESFFFTSEIVRMTFEAIGRLPLEMTSTLKRASDHIIDEADHGEMALRTFKSMGGDEKWAKTRSMTPATFAMIASYKQLIQDEGAAYLGYIYPFECTTCLIAQEALPWLDHHSITAQQREFIDVHAVADIEHQQTMRTLISDIVTKHPKLAPSIEYACDVFLALYPAPIWDAIVERVKNEISS